MISKSSAADSFYVGIGLTLVLLYETLYNKHLIMLFMNWIVELVHANSYNSHVGNLYSVDSDHPVHLLSLIRIYLSFTKPFIKLV